MPCFRSFLPLSKTRKQYNEFQSMLTNGSYRSEMPCYFSSPISSPVNMRDLKTEDTLSFCCLPSALPQSAYHSSLQKSSISCATPSPSRFFIASTLFLTFWSLSSPTAVSANSLSDPNKSVSKLT